jgi:hypothetical protein
VNEHDYLSLLALILWRGCSVVERGLLPLRQNAITGTKIIDDLGAGIVSESFQIDFARPVRFQRDGNRLLLNVSPRNELQPDLWTCRRVHDLA